MLNPRIIPCLLIHNNGLVKTVKFRESKYIGDPINAVKIFNEKEVDELIVLDIDATVQKKEPDYKVIEHLAVECRMPLCYGGGIKTVEQAHRIFNLGVEKIAISSAFVKDPELVSRIAEEVGNQSVVAVLDVKKSFIGNKYVVWVENGKKNTGKCPLELAKQFEKLGVGEIVVNSIDRDGVMKGYDYPLIREFREAVTVPLTVLGGAGSMGDIQQLIHEHKIIGAAAGSLFVFKGVYKAVLISYPSPAEKEKVWCKQIQNHYDKELI